MLLILNGQLPTTIKKYKKKKETLLKKEKKKRNGQLSPFILMDSSIWTQLNPFLLLIFLIFIYSFGCIGFKLRHVGTLVVACELSCSCKVDSLLLNQQWSPPLFCLMHFCTWLPGHHNPFLPPCSTGCVFSFSLITLPLPSQFIRVMAHPRLCLWSSFFLCLCSCLR